MRTDPEEAKDKIMKKQFLTVGRKLEPQILLWVLTAALLSFLLPLTTRSQSLGDAPSTVPGQSATTLGDGRVLLLGGESAGRSISTAAIWDPRTRTTTQISATLILGRAWHTATVLPEGLVLILGGVGVDKQIVSTAEIFDAETQTFASLSSSSLTPRARHTATLLSDGQVLIAGGIGNGGQVLQTAELWDAIETSPVSSAAASSPRRDHSATLLPDGRVLLWGGADENGIALNDGEIFDPTTRGFTQLTSFPSDLFPQSSDGPLLLASIPLDRSVDVDTESMISLRFSKPLRAETVNSGTVSLTGPKGSEKIMVVSILLP